MSLSSPITDAYGPVPGDIVGWQDGDQFHSGWTDDTTFEEFFTTYTAILVSGDVTRIEAYLIANGNQHNSSDDATYIQSTNFSAGGSAHYAITQGPPFADHFLPPTSGSRTTIANNILVIDDGFDGQNRSIVVHYDVTQENITHNSSNGTTIFHHTDYYEIVPRNSVQADATVDSLQAFLDDVVSFIPTPTDAIWSTLDQAGATLVAAGTILAGSINYKNSLGDYKAIQAFLKAEAAGGSQLFVDLLHDWESQHHTIKEQAFQSAGKVVGGLGIVTTVATAGLQAISDFKAHGSLTNTSAIGAFKASAALVTGVLGEFVGSGTAVLAQSVGPATEALGLGVAVGGIGAYVVGNQVQGLIDGSITYPAPTAPAPGPGPSHLLALDAGATSSNAASDVATSDSPFELGQTPPTPDWIYNVDTGEFGWQNDATAGELDRVLTQLDVTDTPVALTLQGDGVVLGGRLDDHLTGGSGDDLLMGVAGNDTLVGGPGTDFLLGGAGADRFVLNTPSEAGDTFGDFSSAEGDKIVLDRAGFGFSATGSLAAAGVDFVHGLTPRFAAPTLLADTGLSFDPDGTGPQAAVLLAHVGNVEWIILSVFS